MTNVTGLSQVCHRFVTGLSQVCHRFVTGLSQVCHRFVTGLSQVCHMLPCDKHVNSTKFTCLTHVFETCDKHVTSQNAIVTCFVAGF